MSICQKDFFFSFLSALLNDRKNSNFFKIAVLQGSDFMKRNYGGLPLTKWAKLRIFWATLTSQRFSGLLWYRVTACTDVGAAHSGTFKPIFFRYKNIILNLECNIYPVSWVTGVSKEVKLNLYKLCANIQPDLNKIEKQTNMFFTDPCYLWGYK